MPYSATSQDPVVRLTPPTVPEPTTIRRVSSSGKLEEFLRSLVQTQQGYNGASTSAQQGDGIVVDAFRGFHRII